MMIVEVKDLSPVQRAAIVVTAIGAEGASEVYKRLADEEVENLTVEIASLPYVDVGTVNDILSEFYELCLTQKVITEGGLDYAKNVLERAYGPELAQRLMDKVSKTMQTKAFEFVRKSDYKNVLAVIQNEHPQTIALVLSYISSEQASKILSELPKEKRVEVVERIAKMEPASPETVKSVEATLERKFASMVSMDLTEVGGINYVADVLNKVDRGTEKFIFDELSAKNPVLVEEIKKKMFVFEDIMSLDSMSIQRFIRDVEMKDLAIAIKGANADVAATLYANMPQRMQESIQQEIEYLHNVRMRDVDEAQQRIVGIIRHLEEEGELVIGKGGDDEIIA
ncbi:MAG: flagellar motor switch protein FliG [Ruminococcus sp.]|jgi:flagellar motor switch protein FliG|nr:flagellar motor switch protein FliG [Ruminococcus sp.]